MPQKINSSPRVEVICVGSELLSGKVNTHVAYIGAKLSEIGLKIMREHTIGDERPLMRESFAESYRRSRVVICAGGLGPTFDDITRDVWSRVLHRPLLEDKSLIEDIEEKFRSRGFVMPPANRRQAMVLRGAEVIPNDNGTAPGQFLNIGGRMLILLPGPTRELVPMFDEWVLPRLRRLFSRRVLKSKTFLLVGVPESKVDQLIRPFVSRYARLSGCEITHGILASQSVVSVKLTVEGPLQRTVAGVIARLSREVKRLLGDMIFGEDLDTLESVIGNMLKRKHQTLAVAESCTGGLISKIITDHAGASEYFVEGVVAYHNRVKIGQLKVKAATLKKFGAVSKETALEMAEGLRRKAKTSYALSVTGVAGPAGGTSAKPVGLVYIGCAGPRDTIVKEFHFTGDRSWIRHRAALVALDILRRQILN